MYKTQKIKTQGGRAGPRGSGFTLLELIAVMGIIVVMSLVVVGSYNGIMNAIAKNAGPRALRNALTLCRQHASVDGDRTYLWITGVNKYILCRKTGVIADAPWAPEWKGLRGDERPPYNREDDPVGPALWVRDKDADVGEALTFERVRQSGGGDGAISSSYVFDFDKSEVAIMQYPAWGDGTSGYLMFGIIGTDSTLAKDGSVIAVKPPAGSFEAGSEYGVALFMEQALPEGYVFARDLYTLDEDKNGEFVKGESVYFEPEGGAGGSKMKLGIEEENNPARRIVVEVREDGKITITDN